MWKGKELKTAGKRTVRKNYWAIVAVCFLLAFVASEYTMTTSGISNYNSSKEYVGLVVKDTNKATMTDSLAELFSGITGSEAILKKLPKGTNGALSGVLNGITSGTTAIRSAIDSFNNFKFKNEILQGILSIVGVLLALLFLLFVQNILKIGERRFVLESRLYQKTHIARILFLYKQRTVWNPAKIMFMRVVFIGLWLLTIGGGFYKYYQYKMMPYILAENPEINYKDAFRISKEMTAGNKWKMFLFQMSFAGWFCLLVVTGGLAGIFFCNPYFRSSEAELYVKLREALLKKCPDEGIFFYDNLLIYPPEGVKHSLYPGLIEHKKYELGIDFRKNYSISNLVLLFMSFTIIGWVWEVLFYFVQDGYLVNRGTFHGPWLPIYGVGGITVLIVLKKVRERPYILFFSTMLICGIIEYFTSWWLEYSKGEKWWDYSGYFLNLNGRICLEGLLVFAIAGSLTVYIIAPRMDKLFDKIPLHIKYPLCIILVTLFGTDAIYSYFYPNMGDGITDNLK